MWVVSNFKLEPVDPKDYGNFHSNRSYVLLYSYNQGKQYILYFWLGDDSSIEDKGSAALLAVEMVRIFVTVIIDPLPYTTRTIVWVGNQCKLGSPKERNPATSASCSRGSW